MRKMREREGALRTHNPTEVFTQSASEAAKNAIKAFESRQAHFFFTWRERGERDVG